VLKLNLGSGCHEIDGFLNLDGFKGDTIYPLTYDNLSEIRASHCLEHFSIDESVDVLFHWVSKLKIGGKLKIAVPDFNDLVRRICLGEILPYEQIIFGGQVDDRDYHKSIWTYDKLYTIMTGAGLTGIKTWQSEIQDCASYPFSLNLEGTKSAQDTSSL